MYQPITDPSGPPGLNLDILRLVCNYLGDVSDVLSFALTCSSLMEDAFRKRLSMSPVTLSNAQSVRIFHTFIFSNEPARAPCIYGLRLLVPFDNDVQVGDQYLVDLVKAAVHIQHLHFHTSISDVVYAAVAEATTLREVSAVCRSFQTRLGYHLTTFRSPLRSLRIEQIDPITRDNLPMSFFHEYLGHLAPALETLDLAYFTRVNIPPTSITTQFTAIRSLKLEARFGFDTLATLLRLFPNLDNRLVLGRRSSLDAGMREYPALREQNLEAQKTHVWPGLDWLACKVDMAFILALQCPIRRLDIEVPEHSAYHVKQYLADTLRPNFPTHLHLTLSFLDGLSVLDGLLTFEAAYRITHLAIAGEFRVDCTKGRTRHKHKEISWNRFFVRKQFRSTL